MRATVTQASTIAVSSAPVGAPHAPQGRGSGFSQMLDAPGPRHATAQAEVQAKPGPATPHEARHRQPRAGTAAAGSGPELDPAVGGALKAVAHAAASHEKEDDATEATDDAGLDAADAEPDKLEAEDRQALPSQIKAEQTISALMAMAPVERRAPHSAAHAGSSKP